MATGNINLARVNISLAEFQKMSDGKYNAGEVKLSSETGLQKVNNHIHRLGANTTQISHEEVLAIKNAFVRALSSSGVDAVEIDKIRSELGLAPGFVADTQLRKRSITPLTRQQIRDIIDRNARALGEAVRAGTIRTSDQLYGGLSDKEKTRRAEKREAAATATFEDHNPDENRSITLFQELIGGTADFQIRKNRTTLLDIARQQADAVMTACNGNPSETRMCILTFTTESGAKIEMPTGLTERKFLEMIDNTCIRLSYASTPTKKTIDARWEFINLPSNERKEYFRALPDDAEGRFKARTALVSLLQEQGIDDYETLSTVNKLPLSKLKLFADSLLTTLKSLTGDDLRSVQFMRLIVGTARNASEAPYAEIAYIPALSLESYNENVKNAIALENGKLPPGVRRLLEQLRSDMHARFGDAVPVDRKLSDLASSSSVSDICTALTKEGKLATADNIREALAEKVLDQSVSDCIYKAAPGFLEKFGGGNKMQFTSLAKKVCPALVAELREARNPVEAAAAIERHSETLLKIAERMGPCTRNERKVVDLYREAFARELDVSVDSVVVKRAGTVHLELLAGSLTNTICSGELALNTEEEIDAAFAKLAADQARERAALLKKVDTLGLSPLAAKMLKRHILVIARTDKFDLDKFKTEAMKMKPQAEKAAQLIDSGASLDDICNAIGDIFKDCKDRTYDLFHKKGQLGDVGADDFFAYGVPMQIIAVDAVPGFMDKIQAFYGREDVKALDFENENSVAARAKSLRYAIDKAAEFSVDIGEAGKND